MNTCHDAVLTEFINETNCSIEVAADILAGTRWNLRAALNFFFDSAPRQAPVSSASSGAAVAGGDEDALYSEKLFFAKEKKKWLCVFLSGSVRGDYAFSRDFDSHFICFVTSSDCSTGQFVREKFQITVIPSLLVIDSETNTLLASSEIKQREEIETFLNRFLSDNKKQLGNEIVDVIVDSAHSKDNSDEPTTKKWSAEESGECYDLLVKTYQNKLIKIRINPCLIINDLHQKIASLININSFELYLNSFNNKLASEDNVTIKEVIPDNSVILIQRKNI